MLNRIEKKKSFSTEINVNFCVPFLFSLVSFHQDHSESAVGVAATMAHEMGHNFGMSHDINDCCQASADDGGCIMAAATGYETTVTMQNPSTSLEICIFILFIYDFTLNFTLQTYFFTVLVLSHPFPRVFNDCNLRELKSYLTSGGGKCLFNMPNTRVMYGGQQCGNGYLEDGEECDCGDEEVDSIDRRAAFCSPCLCTICRDSCPVALPHLLFPQECTSPCCNANNCTLKAGAECAHGVCCQDCKVR